MNINFNNNIPMMGKKLIPLSEYKGVILKLTPTDKSKIAELTQKKSILDLELYKLIQAKRNKKTLSDSEEFYYDCKIDKLEGFIADCDKLIQEIKTNRLNKQKEKLKKLDKIV